MNALGAVNTNVDVNSKFRPQVSRRKGATVKFAITHPIIGHPYDPALVSGKGIAEVAAAAEAAGFHGYGFTDHPAPSQRWLESGGHDALDPFVAMAFAAAKTTTLRLVPNVVVLPYRNPFVVAKAGATLDLLSDGRFTLAVGAGYLKGEFAALGVEHARRNELFNESLAAIKAIWTGDDISFAGEHFNARGITAHPRPVSEPHPPIWIGGNSGQARQRVADFGNGWCPFPAAAGVAATSRTTPLDSHERLVELIDDLRQRVEAADRDPATIDIAFSNLIGSNARGGSLNAVAELDGIVKLAESGVTWLQVPLPGDSLAHVIESIQQYGELVIANTPK